MLQGAEPLLALFERHAKIIIRMQYQRRRLDVLRILERRAIPVGLELVKHIAAEVAAMSESAVARAFVADEVDDAAQRHRRFEAIGVADDPVGHEAAIAAAG